MLEQTPETTKNLKQLLKTTGKYIKILNANGIFSIKDFLEYFPRTYENRKDIKLIKDIPLDGKTPTSIKVQVIEKSILPRRWKKIYEITVQDEEGSIAFVSFFNSYYQSKALEKWNRYIITWKANFKYGKILFSHPESSKAQAPDSDENQAIEEYNIGRIYPIYAELYGIKPARFAKKVRLTKKEISTNFKEYLPDKFLKKYWLMNIPTTIQNMHYPESTADQEQAIKRIFFDRLLKAQLLSLINKQNYQEWKKQNKKTNNNQKNNEDANKGNNREIIKDFLKKLPFELTQAQKKSLKTIIEDIHQEEAMMKLLQGDVWSGKTIVATTAAFYSKKMFWWQSVFLAPLEILANQHYKTLSKLLLPLWLRTELLTWSMSKSQKDKIKQSLADGHIDILVGTHAILQEDVKFKQLHLVIIDEQHKFGVKQRAFFKKFGSPHILQMSATPIPRSMALAFFGEFSVSIIDELPAWRKPIRTKIISGKERVKLKPRVMEKIKNWEQIFIVTPLIEESDKLENTSSALSEFENIKTLYAEIKDQIWLIHGKIKSNEKEKIMQNFKDWKLKILVSTTVIEVWVDIPQATIMVIKNAERFGLSQLHQLRWRIWRSDLQSYCFLETQNKSWDSYKRLKAMEDTTDGFKLAELDLEYRGAWEILGLKQSWEADIPLHILSNIKFIEQVQDAAKYLLEKYPKLEWLPDLQISINDKIWDILA